MCRSVVGSELGNDLSLVPSDDRDPACESLRQLDPKLDPEARAHENERSPPLIIAGQGKQP